MEDDIAIATTQCSSRLHKGHLPQLQHAGVNHPGCGAPPEKAHHQDYVPHAGGEICGQDDHEGQSWNEQDHIAGGHDHLLHNAPVVSGQHPQSRPHDHGYQSSQESDRKRDARGIDQLGENILADIVGAQWVLLTWGEVRHLRLPGVMRGDEGRKEGQSQKEKDNEANAAEIIRRAGKVH